MKVADFMQFADRDAKPRYWASYRWMRRAEAKYRYQQEKKRMAGEKKNGQLFGDRI
jgi:hypothetical protein